MPRWPVKEKETPPPFNLLDHIALDETMQTYLGIEIRACRYDFAMNGECQAVVAMIPGRPTLCRDVNTAIEVIRCRNGKKRRRKDAGDKGALEEAQVP